MKTIYRIISTAIAVMMLGSCGVYRKYERQELWFVDSLYRRIETPQDTLSTAIVSWDRMFVDPILQEWIQ